MPWGFFRIPDFRQPITFFSSVPFGSILQKKNGSSNSLPCCLAGGSFQPYPPKPPKATPAFSNFGLVFIDFQQKIIQKKMATFYPHPSKLNQNW